MPQFNNKFPSEGGTYEGYVMDHKVIDGIVCYKVVVPALHGKDIDESLLPWIPATTPSESGVKSNEIAFDKGQMVHFYKEPGHGGTGLGRITGAPQPKLNTSEMPGNVDLRVFLGIMPKLAEKLPIKIPPDIKKTINEKGVEINEIVEKGEQWMHEHLKGLPVNGINDMLNGAKIPQMKNLSTALDAFENVLGLDKLSQLPGDSMNFSNIFQSLTGVMQNELFKNMPKEVAQAFDSITKLTQNFDAGARSNKVNLEVFLPNVVSMLKDVKSIDELTQNLSKLFTDKSLHGLDALGTVELEIESAFGLIKKTIDKDGNITDSIPDFLQTAIDAFKSSITSIPGTETTMFDSVKEKLNDTIKRLPPEVAKSVQTLLTDHNAPGSAARTKLIDAAKAAGVLK